MAFTPPPYVISEESVMIMLNDESYIMNSTDEHFEGVKRAIKDEDWAKVRELMGIPNERWGILEI